MRYISLYFFGFLIFSLSVSVVSCSGSPRSSAFVPPLLSDTGASTSLFSVTESLLADVDSCYEVDGEMHGGVVEEALADIPGTIKWCIVRYIAINSLAISNEMWFLTAEPVVFIPMVLTWFTQWRHCEVSSRSISFSNKSICLTYTVASSLVCTSPLAVIGLLDVLMVSNLAEIRSSEWTDGNFCLEDFSPSTHVDLVLRLARKVWRQCVLVSARDLGFRCGNCNGLLANTDLFFLPLVTDTFSSFNAWQSLSTLYHCSWFNFPMPGVKVSKSKFLIYTPINHGFQLLTVRSWYLLMNLHVVQLQYGFELIRLTYPQFAQTFQDVIGWKFWHGQ